MIPFDSRPVIYPIEVTYKFKTNIVQREIRNKCNFTVVISLLKYCLSTHWCVIKKKRQN